MEVHVQDQAQVSKRTMFPASLQGTLDSIFFIKTTVSTLDLVLEVYCIDFVGFCWAMDVLDARPTKETSPSTSTKLP